VGRRSKKLSGWEATLRPDSDGHSGSLGLRNGKCESENLVWKQLSFSMWEVLRVLMVRINEEMIGLGE
jgi:hypothetical protein